MAFYIVGAGGFGRETLDAVLAGGQRPAGFLDENRAGQTIRGLPVLPLDDPPAGTGFVVAVADPAVRRRLATQLTSRGLGPRTVTHPRAVIGPETTVGPGCVVLANAHVSSSIRLGAHVQVNYNATVGHDAVLDDYVTVYPGANLSGAVHLEAGVQVGTNACVLQGLRIGLHTFVGAGAVVTRDLAAHQVATGVPARARSRR